MNWLSQRSWTFSKLSKQEEDKTFVPVMENTDKVVYYELFVSEKLDIF